MLTRIISATVGIVILAAVLFFHSTIVLPIAVAAMIAVMLYELLRVVKLHTCIPILAAVELCGIFMPLIYSKYYEHSAGEGANAVSINGDITLISFAVILAAAFVIFVTWLKKEKSIRFEQVFFALAVMILVPQSMTTIVRIERFSSDHGLFLLIMGLCGAWIADTGAYFVGTFCGRHKFCPEISPKKTVEGFIGGIVITGIIFAVIALVYEKFIANDPITINYVLFAAAGLVCAVIGTVGDLSASLVKRQCGIKDYGKIMPGHGGLMDRFDSVLFVLPTFYAFVSLTGIVE